MFKADADRAQAASRVKRWTRERFGLSSETVVVVAESATPLPGFPPRETHVTFWIAEKPYHYKVFKPLAEVAPDDVPPAWLKAALAAGDGLDCGCC
jgi:nitrate reductase molybdenum cofactor assembly chaperone NarJ/NarW